MKQNTIRPPPIQLHTSNHTHKKDCRPGSPFLIPGGDSREASHDIPQILL